MSGSGKAAGGDGMVQAYPYASRRANRRRIDDSAARANRFAESRFLLQFKVVWAQYAHGNSAKIHDVILRNHEYRDTKQ
jgi:hypothetical protein